MTLPCIRHFSRSLSITRWFLIAALAAAAGCTNSMKAELPDALSDYEERLIAHYKGVGSIPVDTTSITDQNRNQIIDDLRYQIDQKYYGFETSLQKQRADFNIATDLAAIGLGSAGALSSKGAANILAAISAGIAGGRTSIDKNYFEDQATSALIFQMRADRAVILTDIQRGKSQNVTEYSLKEGLLDIVRYYNAGRLVNALTHLTETASEANRTAQTALHKIKFADSDLRKRIRDWYKTGGNAALLDAWLAANIASIASYTGQPSSIWVLSAATPENDLQMAVTHFKIPE